LKSPFYRSELLVQFQKWRDLRVEIINEKLSLDEIEIIEDLMDKNLPDTEALKKEINKEEDTFTLDPLLQKALDDLQTTKEHVQKVKLGGILKNMLDLWTIEDIYQACIICTFWMCGKIKTRHSEEEIQIEVNCSDYTPIDCAEKSDREEILQARDQYMEEMLQSFSENDTANSQFSAAEIKTMVKLTFFWIMEIKKSKIQYSEFEDVENKKDLPDSNIYKNLDMTKVEKLTLHYFIEEIESIEELCQNLEEHNPVFENIDSDIGEQTVITI
jgi:hypothetical protein